MIRIIFKFLFVGWLLLPLIASGQSRILTLDISVDRIEGLGIEQQLMEQLSKVGADNVRISKLDQASQPEVKELQGTAVVTVKITGVLQNRQLYLPGAKFAMNDTAGIAAYLQKIRDDGSQVALAEKKAFGLTSEQLVDLHEALSFEITEASLEKSVVNFVAGVRQKVSFTFRMSPEVEAILGRAGQVRDEVQGCSAGTALAIVLRPHGLVLAPRRLQGQPMELAIERSQDVKEFWPVGWPNEDLIARTAPSLLERLDVEIRDFKLADTLQALQSRVKLPMYYDHNNLAEKEVEPSEVVVTYVKKQAEYFMIFHKLLAQAKPALKMDLRVDEAGKPFLWIY